MDNIFNDDWFAFTGQNWEHTLANYMKLLFNRDMRYIAVGRLSILSNFVLFRFFFRLLRHRMAVNRNTEISFENIGGGCAISHCYSITIHAKAKLGKFVSIRKGVTIGTELRGKRKGTPIIGNRVWIGPNATIVGNVSIGDDVLIGPNSFVNFDVPDHSIVIGNPGRIYYKDTATDGYIVYFKL